MVEFDVGEFQELLKAGTFRFVDKVPKGANVVTGKWVHSRKTDENEQAMKPKS